jgi:hypothetical protein
VQLFLDDTTSYTGYTTIAQLKISIFGTKANKSYKNNQQDALYRLIYYSKSALRVSGGVFAHHQEQLTVFTVSDSIHPSCCWLVSWMSWNCVPTHPRHQPAATWVNATRYCKYIQMLLMMCENSARNMQSRIGIKN